jgi:hypothetical protein
VPQRDDDVLTRSRLRDVVIVLSVISALFCHATGVQIVVAFFLLILGSFIHIITKGVLIRNEVLCKDGIYSVVRHPYYLANYVVDTSFCLFSGNSYLLLIYPFLFFWSYGPTLRKEEGTLTEKHGEASVAFLHTTPPIFPDRRTIRNLPFLFAGFSHRRISLKEVARLTRFYAMAFLILACSGIDGAGLLAGRPGLIDGRVLVPRLVAAAVLYGVGLIIMKARTGKRHSG